MATRTISNAGGNWNATGTWVEGAVPTSADDVVATGTSGNVTVNVTTAVCKTLVLTGYVGTMTFTAGQILTVSGNVTLVAGMTYTGTGILVMNASGTLTSNGKTITGDLRATTNETITLGDNAIVLNFNNTSGSIVLNSNQMTVNGNLTVSGALSGTSLIIMGGTGTISTSASSISIGNSITINTVGTITIGTALAISGGTFTYTSGTIAGTGVLYINGPVTLDTSGMTWPTVDLRSNPTITLLSQFKATTMVKGTNVNAVFLGAFNILVSNFEIEPNAIAAESFTIPAGQTLTITNSIAILSLPSSSITFKSGTSSSACFLNYTGALANNKIMNATFTDIDASGSAQPILNYNGGTLTRTVNIQNVNLPSDFEGPAPTNGILVSQVVSPPSNSLRWTGDAGADHYDLYRSSSSLLMGTKINVSPLTDSGSPNYTVNVTDDGISTTSAPSVGVQYFYRLVAAGVFGDYTLPSSALSVLILGSFAPNYIKTAKESALYSLYSAIQNQFSGWNGNLNTNPLTVSPLSYNQNMGFPLITIQDVGGPALGGRALGRDLQEGYKGFEEQTQVEINCYDQNIDGGVAGTSSYSSAEQNVRRLRDLTKDFLENAAYPGATGAQIYGPIHLIDGNNANADTGSQVWFEQETPGAWTETFIENTPDMINVKRYRIYARMHWLRYTVLKNVND